MKKPILHMLIIGMENFQDEKRRSILYDQEAPPEKIKHIPTTLCHRLSLLKMISMRPKY